MLIYFVGGPDVVAIYQISTKENIKTLTTIVLEGYPRPNVTFTLDNEQISTVKVRPGKAYYNHIYTVELPSLSRKMNGKNLRYEAKGYKSTPLIGDILINVLCKYFHVDKKNDKQSIFCFYILTRNGTAY